MADERTSEVGVILNVTAEVRILTTLNKQIVVPILILEKKLMNIVIVTIPQLYESHTHPKYKFKMPRCNKPIQNLRQLQCTLQFPSLIYLSYMSILSITYSQVKEEHTA